MYRTRSAAHHRGSTTNTTPHLTKLIERWGGSICLEDCVEVENVADLERRAVIHDEVSAHDNVYVVWRRRWQHRFQLMRTGLHSTAQSRRQAAIHDQLPLQTRRQTISLRQAGWQMLVVSTVPFVNIAVMIVILFAAVSMAVTVAVAMTVVVIIAILVVPVVIVIVAIVFVVTVSVPLRHSHGRRKCQSEQSGRA